MSTKLIQTDLYLLLIDEEAEIKEGDTIYENISGVFAPYEKEDVVENPIKIIAYYPLTKEAKELDLPLLPNPFKKEVDVEELAIKSANDNFESGNSQWINDFIEGYKAAQSKQFSLEDIEKALEHGWFRGKEHGIRFGTQIEGEDRRKDIKQYLQSLSTQQLPKEFIPEYEEYSVDIPFGSGTRTEKHLKLKTITNSEGKEEIQGKYVY